MRITVFIALLFFALPLTAQIDAVIDIEFAKDKFSLRPADQAKLDTFINTQILVDRLLYIEITGHTDSDASNAYNERLSKRRAETVATAFKKLALPDSIFRISYKGEEDPIDDNATEEGMQHNRRVHIVAMHLIRGEKPPCATPPPPPCLDDTMIVLPEGTMYKINKCFYLKNPDCVKLTEIYSADAMIEHEMETMTHGHEPLISGGMLKYDICDDKQVQVFMPLREDCDGEDMSYWERTENGTWNEVSKRPIKPITLGDRRYYPIMLSGRGACNMDKRVPLGPPPPKTRFKVKWRADVRLQSLTIYCDCPLSAINVPAKNKRQRRIVINSMCCPDAKITFEATDKKGNPLRFDFQPLDALKGASSLGQCRTDIRRQWWFFKTWNKVMYRKYRISRRNFKE